MAAVPHISEAFRHHQVSAVVMDGLWAQGWRHFGDLFFRYSRSEGELGTQTIQPLRIQLREFVLSSSQKRVLRRNGDVLVSHRPVERDAEEEALFERHRKRFQTNLPEGLSDFLGEEPSQGPCACQVIRCQVDGELVAASYLDCGVEASSSVYGTFDPKLERRSLGIFTLLTEIELSRRWGMKYFYPGYASVEPSAYDYKKRFYGLESFDWETGEWRKLERLI